MGADDAGAAAACDRMAEWFAGRADGLAFTARLAALHLAVRAEAVPVRTAGRRALAAALEAGFDRAAADGDVELRRLREP